jgi:ATP-dependent helicase/DNAse subunit B
VLEDFHLAYLEGSQDPYNVIMGKSWKSGIAEFSENMTSEMRKECWNLIDQYLRIVTEDKKNNSVANVIAVEKKFELPISENVILNGMIDRIQIDSDGILHVADYKTSKSTKFLRSDWFQLLTYAFVLLSEDSSIKKVRGSYIMLKHNFEYISKDFSLDEILAMKEKYLQYAEQILTEKEFAPTPTQLCGWCDFLSSCASGLKQTRMFNGEVNW